MKLSAFDYSLPPDRIAQYPSREREAARLLLMDRRNGRLRHHRVADLPDLLRPGDCLVINTTRVMPARLVGWKTRTGGRVELLLLGSRDGGPWQALARGRLRPGDVLRFDGTELGAQVVSVADQGRVELRLEAPDPMAWLQEVGRVPLPPYIRRNGKDQDLDRERYQTVYAQEEGSVAAPTAGLHFSERLLEALRQRGVEILPLVLHVGPGTFQPVRTEKVEQHRMEAEVYRIPQDTAKRLEAARREGRRIVAVGTTTTRALETAFACQPPRTEGTTDLFIYPGYTFRAVDALLTNFHLPRSTLLMLVCAFAGTQQVLAAYREAVARGYRFYSYGDAMLIL